MHSVPNRGNPDEREHVSGEPEGPHWKAHMGLTKSRRLCHYRTGSSVWSLEKASSHFLSALSVKSMASLSLFCVYRSGLVSLSCWKHYLDYGKSPSKEGEGLGRW